MPTRLVTDVTAPVERVDEIGQVVAFDAGVTDSHGVRLDPERVQAVREPFKCGVRSAECEVVVVGQGSHGVKELLGGEAAMTSQWFWWPSSFVGDGSSNQSISGLAGEELHSKRNCAL